MAISTTERPLDTGSLKTSTPASAQAALSTESSPMQHSWTACRSGAPSTTARVIGTRLRLNTTWAPESRRARIRLASSGTRSSRVTAIPRAARWASSDTCGDSMTSARVIGSSRIRANFPPGPAS